MIRLRLGHNGQDLHGRAHYVVEHTDFLDPKPILRLRKTPKALDAASAGFGRLVPEMYFERFFHRGADIGLQRSKVLDCLRRKKYLKTHSGYIIARISIRGECPPNDRVERLATNATAHRPAHTLPWRARCDHNSSRSFQRFVRPHCSRLSILSIRLLRIRSQSLYSRVRLI